MLMELFIKHRVPRQKEGKALLLSDAGGRGNVMQCHTWRQHMLFRAASLC